MAKGDFVFEVNEAEYARLTSALEQLSEIEQSTVIKQGLKQGSTMNVFKQYFKTTFLINVDFPAPHDALIR